MLRRLILMAALVAALPAVAQEDRLAGQWVSDVTGEPITITLTKGVGLEVTFAATGQASLSPSGDVPGASIKMSFKSGMFSSTDCYYEVIRLKGGDRMVWSVKKGPDTCPRGAFSRYDGHEAVVKPPIVKGGPVVREPPMDPMPRVEGTPARIPALVGKWANRDGITLVFRKGFEGHELWVGDIGQGSVVETGPPGAMQVGFGGGKSCAFNAKMVESTLVIETSTPSCTLSGSYKRI